MITFGFQAPLASRCYSHGKVETDEEFDARWVTYFSKPDIDTWELRKGELDALFYYPPDMAVALFIYRYLLKHF